MNSSIKRVLSIIVIACVAFMGYVTVNGIGDLDDLKNSLDYGLDIDGGVYVVMQADTSELTGDELRSTMEQTREVLNKRVDAMGVSNATVAIEGENRIRVEMPGVSDAQTAINRIGQTAQLKFTLSDGTEVMDGKEVRDAAADTDTENGGYKIVMQFTPEGQQLFADATEKASSGQVTATVTYPGTTSKVDDTAIIIWLDDEILTAPSCHEKIDSDSCEITSGAGGYSKEEATETSALIRGGALPLALEEVESSVQTASIGEGALDKSITAGLIGLGIVCVLMILMYSILGIAADIALLLYIMLVLWIMSMMGAVLTLPGIAGIVLGIGMAVDANVIIFSRIKEELGLGRSIRVAVDQGFRHALVTVLDAQITTLIATVVLYELGSTTVKGFAITLAISIIVSIFTAVVVTQVLVGAISSLNGAKPQWFGCKADGTPRKLVKKEFAIIEKRKYFYILSGAVILAGMVFLGVRGFNYGIDFTGGTMIQMNLGQKVEIEEVEKAVESYDLEKMTIVYSGEESEGIILKTTTALNADQRAEVSGAIEASFGVDENSVVSSSEFGPVIGQELSTNALKAILIAALCMLLYIIFRFRSWKYGVAAVAGVLHDALVMVALYAIFHITVDNPFVAAILTVVGYSINDTIVIFDRVRENSRLMRGNPILNVLNRSINQTLDRSVMTSLTTLASIIPLLLMVSAQLMQFVFPLMVGVLVGTYSSIFLCSPLYYEFNKKQEQSKYLAQQKARQRIESKRAAKKEQPQVKEEEVKETVEKAQAVKEQAPKAPAKKPAQNKTGKKYKKKKK